MQDILEEIRQIRQAQRDDMIELRATISNIVERFQNHVENSASRWTEVDQRSKAAHARLDEHLTEHTSWRHLAISIWIAVATTIVSSLVTLWGSFLQKG